MSRLFLLAAFLGSASATTRAPEVAREVEEELQRLREENQKFFDSAHLFEQPSDASLVEETHVLSPQAVFEFFKAESKLQEKFESPAQVELKTGEALQEFLRTVEARASGKLPPAGIFTDLEKIHPNGAKLRFSKEVQVLSGWKATLNFRTEQGPNAVPPPVSKPTQKGARTPQHTLTLNRLPLDPVLMGDQKGTKMSVVIVETLAYLSHNFYKAEYEARKAEVQRLGLKEDEGEGLGIMTQPVPFKAGFTNEIVTRSWFSSSSSGLISGWSPVSFRKEEVDYQWQMLLGASPGDGPIQNTARFLVLPFMLFIKADTVFKMSDCIDPRDPSRTQMDLSASQASLAMIYATRYSSHFRNLDFIFPNGMHLSEKVSEQGTLEEKEEDFNTYVATWKSESDGELLLTQFKKEWTLLKSWTKQPKGSMVVVRTEVRGRFCGVENRFSKRFPGELFFVLSGFLYGQEISNALDSVESGHRPFMTFSSRPLTPSYAGKFGLGVIHFVGMFKSLLNPIPWCATLLQVMAQLGYNYLLWKRLEESYRRGEGGTQEQPYEYPLRRKFREGIYRAKMTLRDQEVKEKDIFEVDKWGKEKTIKMSEHLFTFTVNDLTVAQAEELNLSSLKHDETYIQLNNEHKNRLPALKFCSEHCLAFLSHVWTFAKTAKTLKLQAEAAKARKEVDEVLSVLE